MSTCTHIKTRGKHAGTVCGSRGVLRGCGYVLCNIHRSHDHVDIDINVSEYIKCLLAQQNSDPSPTDCLCGDPALAYGVCDMCITCADLTMCRSCKRIGRASDMYYHMMSSHQTKTIVPYKTVDSVNHPVIQHLLRDRETEYECECGLMFEIREEYMTHVGVHFDDEGRCKLCGHDSYFQHRHILLDHAVRVVKCPLVDCGVLLADGSYETMDRHLLCFHRPTYKCDMCGSTQLSYTDMYTHMQDRHVEILHIHNWSVYAHAHKFARVSPSQLAISTMAASELVQYMFCLQMWAELAANALYASANTVPTLRLAVLERVETNTCRNASRLGTKYESMPADTWMMIMDYAGTSGRLALSQTCKRLNSLWEQSGHAKIDRFVVQVAAMARLDAGTDLDRALVPSRWAAKNSLVDTRPGGLWGKVEITQVAKEAYKKHKTVSAFLKAFVVEHTKN